VIFVTSTMFTFSEHIHEMKDNQRIKTEPALSRALGDYLEYFSLYEAISSFSHKQCSDLRDKVYGLLGMVIPSERVEVDYNLTVREIFQMAVGSVVHAEAWLQTKLHHQDFAGPMIALGVGMGLDIDDVNEIYRSLYVPDLYYPRSEADNGSELTQRNLVHTSRSYPTMGPQTYPFNELKIGFSLGLECSVKE